MENDSAGTPVVSSELGDSKMPRDIVRAMGLAILKQLHRLTLPETVRFIRDNALRHAYDMTHGNDCFEKLLTDLTVLVELARSHPTQYPGGEEVLQVAKEALLGQLQPDGRMVALYALPYGRLPVGDQGYCRGAADLYDSLIGHSRVFEGQLERMTIETAAPRSEQSSESPSSAVDEPRVAEGRGPAVSAEDCGPPPAVDTAVISEAPPAGSTESTPRQDEVISSSVGVATVAEGVVSDAPGIGQGT